MTIVDLRRIWTTGIQTFAQAAVWCEYQAAHARRLYAAVTDAAPVAS